MNDPQATFGFILKPPAGFEALYQDQDNFIPIPLVPNVNGVNKALDPLVGSEHIEPTLLAYAPVPLGATIMLLIPRCQVFNGEVTVEEPYVYELNWRLRAMSDWQKSAAEGRPEMPYHTDPSQFGPINMTPMPAYTSEAITPTVVGVGLRPLLALPSTLASAAQGLLDIASNPFAQDPNFFFPPILRPCVGDQLSVFIHAVDRGTWDFDTTDSPLSNIYGVGRGTTAHPILPALGAYLFILNRNTTP